MNKKQIIYFYTGIATLCVLLVWLFIWVAQVKTEREKDHQIVRRDRLDADYDPSVKTKLITDLRCIKQDGEEVGLLDLEGKVFVFAQFYANCPDCMTSNMGPLKAIQEKYKNEPDVHIVIITVASDDTEETIGAFCENFGVDPEKWWVLRTDIESLSRYSRKELLYADFKKNEGKDASARPYLHDMRIAIFDAELQMRGMVDLFGLNKKEYPETYAASRENIDRTIEWCLEQKRLKQ